MILAVVLLSVNHPGLVFGAMWNLQRNQNLGAHEQTEKRDLSETDPNA